MNKTDPHADQPLLHAGSNLEPVNSALILIHGRGGDARNMLSLFDELKTEHLAALAPQAFGNTWYPHSFLSPIKNNQPFLDSALARIESLVIEVLKTGIPSSRIALLGFSQGACLTAEFVARNPRRYGAVMALAGGLIGPAGTPRHCTGSLAKTPIFLGCGDPDPHVPFDRVLETESLFKAMDASVEVRRYPGMPHSINEDELEVCRTLLNNLR